MFFACANISLSPVLRVGGVDLGICVYWETTLILATLIIPYASYLRVCVYIMCICIYTYMYVCICMYVLHVDITITYMCIYVCNRLFDCVSNRLPAIGPGHCQLKDRQTDSLSACLSVYLSLGVPTVCLPALKPEYGGGVKRSCIFLCESLGNF